MKFFKPVLLQLFLVLLLHPFLLVGFQSSDVFTVQKVPNPKTEKNGYVSDPAHILKNETTADLEGMLRKLEDSTTTQVAVVVLPSIGDPASTGEAEVFDFAQSLFQTWGIGQKKVNNGLLVLMVMDVRIIRMHTGKGLEGILSDVVTKRIQREHMVPLFKEGNYDAGLLQGVGQVVRLLSDPVYAAEFGAPSDDDDVETERTVMIILSSLSVLMFLLEFFAARSRPKVPDERLHFLVWVLLNLLVPILIQTVLGVTLVMFGVLYGYWLLLALWRYFRIVQLAGRLQAEMNVVGAWTYLESRRVHMQIFTWILPLPFLFMRKNLASIQDKIRTKPRPCKSCHVPMSRLDELADDEFLASGARMEEQVGSVDYDVWRCPTCQATECFAFPNSRSTYGACSECNSVTYFMESSRELRAATTMYDGEREQNWRCCHCNHHQVVSVVIPRIQESSSSGSNSGGGSSFGGGSSGGGGSSSSW